MFEVTAFLRQSWGQANGHGHPWQVLLQDGCAHELPRALDGRRILRRWRRGDDRWHGLRLREERRVYNAPVDRKCRERDDRRADGNRERILQGGFHARSVAETGRGVFTDP